MSPQNQIKFPLGGDLYLTSAIWRGVSKIHIRKYITVRDRLNNNPKVIPTRYGVTMNVNQVQQLISAIPLCLTALKRLEETYSTPNGTTLPYPAPDVNQTTTFNSAYAAPDVNQTTSFNGQQTDVNQVPTLMSTSYYVPESFSTN